MVKPLLDKIKSFLAPQDLKEEIEQYNQRLNKVVEDMHSVVDENKELRNEIYELQELNQKLNSQIQEIQDKSE